MKSFKTFIKTGLCIISIMFVFTAAAYAANGDVAGDIYSTDILAVVNGFPMESYNIGGKTAVIAEDLSAYGFGYEYNDNDRTLYVWSSYKPMLPPEAAENVKRGLTGATAGNFYETDVKVVFNGYEVTGYNIGGKMSVCIEDIGTPDDSANAQYGYTKYLCSFTYNNDTRTVTLDSFTDNLSLYHMYENIGYSHISCNFISENVIELTYDPMVADIEINGIKNVSDEKNVLKPLYFSTDGNLTPIGLCYIPPEHYNDFDDIRSAVYYEIDYDKAKYAVESQLKRDILPYDEAVRLFYESGKYIVHDRCENSKYTVLLVSDTHEDMQTKADGGFNEEKFRVMVINKSGGYFRIRNIADYQTLTMTFLNDDTVEFEIYPFASMHGLVTMSEIYDLSKYD